MSMAVLIHANANAIYQKFNFRMDSVENGNKLKTHRDEIHTHTVSQPALSFLCRLMCNGAKFDVKLFV